MAALALSCGVRCITYLQSLTTTAMAEYDSLVTNIFEIGAVKFGSFKLKSGITSPVYVDLRLLPSHPRILDAVVDQMIAVLKKDAVAFDLVCGVPYTALPMATLLSQKLNVPMIICRKEQKSYGTMNQVDGKYAQGQSCLIMEDVITSGVSILQTTESLRKAGLKVSHAVVFLNREQGGVSNLASHEITVHSTVPVSRALEILQRKKLLTDEVVASTKTFLAGNTVTISADSLPKRELHFSERAQLSQSQVAKRLFALMAEKKTNVGVAADCKTSAELLQLTDSVGPHICVLKTHIDMIEDFDASLPHKLMDLAKKHNFLIFEDRKFADIGAVAKAQYEGGVYKIAQWANLVTAHIVAGEQSVSAFKDAATARQNGVLLIAQMSSAGSLTGESFVETAKSIARKNADFVCGFICQERLAETAKDLGFVYATPGVSLESTSDSLGQQYNTPQHVISQKKTDLIIVGRGITQSADPVAAAELYRDVAWAAYESRLHHS